MYTAQSVSAGRTSETLGHSENTAVCQSMYGESAGTESTFGLGTLQKAFQPTTDTDTPGFKSVRQVPARVELRDDFFVCFCVQ